jgi:hypothetical protein
VDSVRVYPPKPFALICGGEVGTLVDIKPKSLRDAFLRGGGFDAFKGASTLEIEKIEEFFDKESPYIDLVKFEADMAQICEMVLLFSESPGSFTELGSFAMIEGMSEKILVAIQGKYTSKATFITKGPLANLRREHPKSVYSFADATVDIIDGDLTTVDCEKLAKILIKPIADRLDEIEKKTTLQKNNFNHLCKLYVGILRESYCLKDDEIILLLDEFGFSVRQDLLDRVACCCKVLGWSSTLTSGFDRVHFALDAPKEAAKITFRAPLMDKIRRRAEFRNYWIKEDSDRVSAVDQVRK